MNTRHLIKFNLEEARRRSLILWKSLPREIYHWRPDNQAMAPLEMVRHVLEGEYLDHKIIENRGMLKEFSSPWKNLPLLDVQTELKFAEKFRIDFLKTVEGFTTEALDDIRIENSETGKYRKLGVFLLIIAYHEAVHTGQLLTYLRVFGAPRPSIWK